MKLTCLLALLLSLAPPVEALALDLNGCWHSRDATLQDEYGNVRSCESGIYMHLNQDPQSFELELLEYSCNREVPAYSQVGRLEVKDGYMRSEQGVIGKIGPESASLTLAEEVPTVVDEMSWTLKDSNTILFKDELHYRNFIVRTVSGMLSKTRCLE
jgi:hypothetical protein